MVFRCAKFGKWEIWYTAKFLPPKYSFSWTKQVILDITFLVIDICQQIISTVKITAINEATTGLKKLQVGMSENKLAIFYWREERFTFVKQIFQDLHFVFERLYV